MPWHQRLPPLYEITKIQDEVILFELDTENKTSRSNVDGNQAYFGGLKNPSYPCDAKHS